MKPFPAFRLLALTLLFPALACAHPGHDGHELTWDFTSGLSHPLFGWDHVLAMLAVGMWATRLGGRARWMVPGSFVAAMAAAAAISTASLTPGAIDQGILASLLVFGLLVAFAVRLPLIAAAPLVAAFAAFHGWAHSAEMPAQANAWSYGAGFILSTLLLQGAGLRLGAALANRRWALASVGFGVASFALLLAIGY